MSSMLFAAFHQPERADEAVAALRAVPDCKVVVHEDFTLDEHTSVQRLKPQETDTRRGFAIGSIVGTVTGGLVGLALGSPSGLLQRLGMPVTTALGLLLGFVVGGAVAALVGTAIPARPLRTLEDELQEGDVLISVQAPDQETSRRVQSILESRGARVAS